jgi:hypothetical protein
MVRLISRLLGAFAIGIILSVWIIQRNDQVQKTLTTKLLNLLEKEWDSKISTEMTNINFFSCSATLYNVSIKPLAHKNCSWRVKEAKIYISPIAYLFDKTIKITLTLREIDAASGISQNSFELKEHIQGLLKSSSPDSNICIHALHIINAKFELKTPTSHRIKLDINGRFDLEEPRSFKPAEKIWSGRIKICGCQVFWNDNKFIKNFVLSSNFKKGNLKTPFELTADGSFKTCLVEGLPKYQLHAELFENKVLLINNESNKVSLSAKQLAGSNNLHIDGTLPIELTAQIYQFFNQSPQTLPDWLKQTKGTSSFNFDVMPTDQWKISQSNITLQNVDFQKINLDLLELKQIRYDGQNLSADLHSIVNKNFEFSGLIDWSRQKNICDLSISNTKPLNFEKTSWQIDANGCYIKAKIDNSGLVTGIYKTNIINHEQKQKLNWQGDYKLTQQNLITNGKTQHGDYVVHANFLPTPHITKWTYECKNKKILDLSALTNNGMILGGSVRFALIRSWLSSSLKSSLAGKGCVLHLKIDQNNWLQPKGEIKLEEGKFYLPGNRNLITTFNSEFETNLPEREVKIQKAFVGFCKGQIICPQAIISLDDNNSLKMIHIPLQVNDLMVNWKRDMYAIVYGNLLVNKLPQKITTVSGDIILKASLLKESLLSGDSFGAYSTGGLGFTEAMSNLVFDVHITNEKPIRVKTQALEANANLDLKVLYTQNNLGLTPPRITGTINLENGYLKFLKNKLAIETGRIQFLANQLNDPTIDLVARNKINKYMITLQTTGTLQKPTIILESNPDLTEEQILSLLLGGSETASLQNDLPAMLMQNMSTLVLGERKLKSQTNALFEKITRPLKYVQISPNFTDQSGRGGVKCVIPVDLNNQLHAQIQKNLNMQEDDWGVQVEYLLTDDINVKGVRDQRGEVGAEVEVRFKL